MFSDDFDLGVDYKVLVKYGEIALKGKNRGDFVNLLIKNIFRSAKLNGVQILELRNESNRFVIDFEVGSNKEMIASFLSKIFGIKYFSFAYVLKKDPEFLFNVVEHFLKRFASKFSNIKEISIKTKRADKSFPLKSPEINSCIGKIANKYGLIVNYKSKSNVLFVEVSYKAIYFYMNRFSGLGGLPVDGKNKVLMLLSGGIDSPVASFQLMKRGCNVDFLHIHNFSDNRKVLSSKMFDLIKVFNNFQYESKVFLIPYFVYQFNLMNRIYSRYEVLLFKYYIFKLAERIALENGYFAIASGDNLNQVASQTLANIFCVSSDLRVPVYRPLLSYDKEEIIVLARRFNTYDLSIVKYPDCCSINAKNPFTQCNFEKFKIDVLDKISVDSLIEESLKELSVFYVNEDSINEVK